MPSPSAVFAVTGPMHATRVFFNRLVSSFFPTIEAKFVTVGMEHTAFRLYWLLRAYKEHDEDLLAQHINYELWREAWQGPLGFAEGRDILPVQTAHIPADQLRIRKDPHGAV